MAICPSGTYPDSTLVCIACDSPCKTCSGGSTLCTSCVSNSSTPYLEFGTNTCKTGCPNGQYLPNSTFLCALCNANCLTCSSSPTNCTSCGLSLSSGLQLYLFNNTCLATCPSGKYGDSSNACSSCDTSCNGCITTSTNCIACNSSHYRKVGSNECTSTCPSGYYGDSSTNLCTLCPPGCKTCNITACTECQVSAGVSYYLDSTTNRCVPQCPSTYYPASGSTPACTACSGNCATCTDASTCLTCVTGKYLGFG